MSLDTSDVVRDVAKVSEALRTRAEKGPTPVKGLVDFEERTDLALFNEEELNVKLREALSAGEVLDHEVEIKFAPNPDGVPWISFQSESGRDLYVGEVSGAQFAEMYREYKYKLFAMNIRDYVGESSTNKGIMESATKQPHEFVFYNFGHSIITFRFRAGRLLPSDPDELFEQVYIGLYEHSGEKNGEVAFFNVVNAPPRTGRPEKKLQLDELIGDVVKAYGVRNRKYIEWSDETPSAVPDWSKRWPRKSRRLWRKKKQEKILMNNSG